MLEELLKNAIKAQITIDVQLGKVEDLLTYFPEKRFTVVTAFSAFTLFQSAEAIKAIASILTPGGYFIDAGDDGHEVDILGDLMQEIIKNALGVDIASSPRNGAHDEKQHFEQNNFEKIVTKEIPVTESYTFEQTLAHFKSRLNWPVCTSIQEAKVQDSLKEYFTSTLQSVHISVHRKYTFTAYQRKV